MFEKEEAEDSTTKLVKYSVGQEVVVVDEGKCYSTYYDWISDNKLNLSDDKVRKLWLKYLDAEHNACKAGSILTVVATGCHGTTRVAMYLCEDTNGNPVLISEDGLVKEGILKEKMNKDLNEVFDVKSIIDFQFDLLGKAYLKGLETGIEIGKSEKDD